MTAVLFCLILNEAPQKEELRCCYKYFLGFKILRPSMYFSFTFLYDLQNRQTYFQELEPFPFLASEQYRF